MGRLLGFVWDGLQIIRCDLCVQYLRVWLFCVLWILLSWADALPSLWIKRLVVCRLGDDVHFFYTVFDLDWDPICKTSDWSDISNLLTWLGSDFLDSIWKRQKIDFGWLSLVVWSQAHRVFEQDTGPQVAPALFSVVVKVEQGLIRSVSSYLNLCANKHLPVSWCLALMIFFVERERGSKQSVTQGSGHDWGTVPVRKLHQMSDSCGSGTPGSCRRSWETRGWRGMSAPPCLGIRKQMDCFVVVHYEGKLSRKSE